MYNRLSTILNSYSEIFFIQGIIPGTILLIVSLLNYNVALAGLIAIFTAYAFAYFIGFKTEYLSSGFYTYNPLLVGLSIGYLFKLNPLTISFILIASILAFVITAGLANFFSVYLKIPILSVPFVIVSSLVYLASAKYTNLFVNSLYTHKLYQNIPFLPDWLNGFFKSVGAIIFMPNAISGLLIILLILYKSRILFVLAISGFLVGGTIQGLFIGSISKAMTDISSFNYILISIAIGAIYVIPSFQSYIMALIGVAVSTIIISASNVFWAQFGIPIFTLPFTIVTLSVIYLLGLVNYRLRPIIYKATPEETLDNFITTLNRSLAPAISLSLPFSDSWTVWQGFNGKWTHKGAWQYAYDFVKTDNNKLTYKNKGNNLEDYYCYKQNVLSPVRGRVIKVISDLPDNPIKAVNTSHNWGNIVTIQDIFGNYILLAHFAKDSLKVKTGDWIEPGDLLGLCGNSGYSPQPHIHIQVQATAETGSATFPFKFIHYSESNEYNSKGLPDISSVITNSAPIPFYDQLTTFILDEVYTFDVLKSGIPKDSFEAAIHMALDGTFYFETKRAKLYFGKQNGTFYVYHLEGQDPYLRLLFLALPKMPLHYTPALTWTDYIPSYVLLSGIKRFAISLINAVNHKITKTPHELRFLSETEIAGTITEPIFGKTYETYVKCSPYNQLETIRVDNYELRKQIKI
jgi:urea transporter